MDLLFYRNYHCKYWTNCITLHRRNEIADDFSPITVPYLRRSYRRFRLGCFVRFKIAATREQMSEWNLLINPRSNYIADQYEMSKINLARFNFHVPAQ